MMEVIKFTIEVSQHNGLKVLVAHATDGKQYIVNADLGSCVLTEYNPNK